MKYNSYLRPALPSCIEVSLFDDESGLNDLLSILFRSGLTWYWTSERQWDALEEYRAWELPTVRFLTRLSEETRQLLYMDFLEEDTDQRRRTVVVLGLSPDENLTSAGVLKDSLSAFASSSKTGIKFVIHQMNDMRCQYVFFQTKPAAEETRKFLERCGIVEGQAENVYDYRRLRLAQLEHMIDSIAKSAFP